MAITFPVWTPGAKPVGSTVTMVIRDVAPAEELTEIQAWSVVRTAGQWHRGTPACGGHGEVSPIATLWAAGSERPAVQLNDKEAGLENRL